MLKKSFILLILILMMLLPSISLLSPVALGAGTVFIIPVSGEIGPALSEFVISNVNSAVKQGASIIILEVDTLGGRLDYTLEIKDCVNDAITGGVQVITFVDDQAQSAGVMITMLGQKVAMVPGSSIGSAEVRPFDEKTNSFWAGQLRDLAESRGRNGEIVASMADKDIAVNGIKEKGKLLNLSANQAKALGICDNIVKNRQELLDEYNISDASITDIQPNFKTRIAEFVSGRYVAPLLLILGIVALVVEVFTPSFGILGTVGFLSLSTYFAGSILAGRSGWGAAILFIAGIVLLGIEAAIPGFGAAGIGGLISIAMGIVFSAGDIIQGMVLLLAVIITLVIALWMLIKYAPRTRLFKKIVLDTQMKPELGFSSSTADTGLAGREGISVTVLRPSGKVDVGGRKVDVTTEGDFVMKGVKVRVIKVEGNKIVVEKINSGR